MQGPLLELAPRLAQHMAPGGWALLSGILEGGQVTAVIGVYEAAGFECFDVESHEGWALVSCRRSSC